MCLWIRNTIRTAALAAQAPFIACTDRSSFALNGMMPGVGEWATITITFHVINILLL